MKLVRGAAEVPCRASPSVCAMLWSVSHHRLSVCPFIVGRVMQKGSIVFKANAEKVITAYSNR